MAECAGSPRRAARCSCCPSRRPWPGWAPYGPDGEDAVDEDGTDYWRLCSALAGDVWVWPVAGVEGLAFDEGRSPTTFLPGSGVFAQDRSSAVVTERVVREAVAAGLRWHDVGRWRCAGPCSLFDATAYGPG